MLSTWTDTDAYNKAQKNKMTKADYVKNTKLDGLSTELLEVRPGYSRFIHM